MIAGIPIKDIDEVPESGHLILPVIFPQPSGWVSDILPERKSFGTGGSEKQDFNYTLHYVFLMAEQGSGLSQTDLTQPLAEAVELILETILTNDIVTGLVDMQVSALEMGGNVQDPSGNMYWGALFSLRCLEFAT